MKTYVIGDIHGCSSALSGLLDILKPDPARDRIVFLGDLFDRGPDSYGVYQKIRELAAAFGERFILLRGNHEDYLLQPRLSEEDRLTWEYVGRGASVRSFLEHGEKMEDCIPWLTEHCVMYFKGEHFQCVHAGMMLDPPEINDTFTLLHDHGIVMRNHYKGPLTITGHIALQAPTYFAGDEETVKELPERVCMELPKTGFLCIDAGCGKGGRLIGMKIEDSCYTLYGVNEDGTETACRKNSSHWFD